MAEVRLAAVVVGQRAVVHHLQQQVEDIRVRLLDLIEQQHAVRMLGDRFGQQSALVEADIARRRADEARDGVPLHVFRHVEAQELDAHRDGELAGDFGLADAGGAGEEEAADGLALIAEARAGHLDRGRQRVDGAVLAEDDELEIALQILQHLPVGSRDALRRDAGHARHDVLDVAHLDDRLPFADRLQALPRPGLIDDVDRLVGQVPLVDMPRGELRCRLQCVGRVGRCRGAPRSAP